MGSIGTSADNALAESFNAAMKREVLQDSKTFINQLICRSDVFHWCTQFTTRCAGIPGVNILRPQCLRSARHVGLLS